MNHELLPFLCIAILIVALLYSAVGHAGASGYIAVMTLFGLADKTIRPAALVLNVLVAALTTWQFRRAGHFSWRLFWPFALGSIPLAFVGGYVTLPTRGFKMLVGIVLLFSALRFWWNPRETEVTQMPKESLSIAVGGGLGLLSGLTGTGGGIFLTPVLLLKRWATTKERNYFHDYEKSTKQTSRIFFRFNSQLNYNTPLVVGKSRIMYSGNMSRPEGSRLKQNTSLNNNCSKKV